jgi:hypothetical protein
MNSDGYHIFGHPERTRDILDGQVIDVPEHDWIPVFGVQLVDGSPDRLNIDFEMRVTERFEPCIESLVTESIERELAALPELIDDDIIRYTIDKGAEILNRFPSLQVFPGPDKGFLRNLFCPFTIEELEIGETKKRIGLFIVQPQEFLVRLNSLEGHTYMS